MFSSSTILDAIEKQAEANPEQEAIATWGYPSLSYGKLRSHLYNVVAKLRAQGIQRGDRVALVLPNGPAMATAFLATTAGATCAPLNPGYQADEFEFYLSDLQAKLLIIQANLDSPARQVAEQKGIPILELIPQPDIAAGLFRVVDGDFAPGMGEDLSDSERGEIDYARAEDIALVLHTSGTTSRPKIVPLTQRNICTSVRAICQSLQLTEADRCLHAMPMFHIGGLIDLTLAPLAAGGTVIYTGGFSAEIFFQQLAAHRPTWYQAVPTMLQEILDTANSRTAFTEGHSLRFIRSVAAALPSAVKTAIAERFQVPVVETYGMTEAAPLIASTSLLPAEQKSGSVGQSVGPEIAILNAAGKPLPAGEIGEVAIRGDNVISAYENNPVANASTFAAGWFRTGDLGYLDGDRHLYLQGRLKEIINRGGQKISPAEVDEVLLQHPGIYQAVTFAMPHRSLGEEVAAAIALKPGANLTPSELTAFATERLARYKVPRVIRFVADIPKGPTGKLQRIGLAERLNLASAGGEFVPPETELEGQLVGICERMLGLSGISVRDNFFAIGGNSLLAVRFCAEVSQHAQVQIPTAALFQTQSLQELAQVVDRASERPSLVAPGGSDRFARGRRASNWDSLVPLKADGSKEPVFLVHDADGETVLYLNLARHLDADRPVYGLRPYSKASAPILHTRIPEMAAYYVEKMRAIQPQGPYCVGGLCAGGVLAFEIACQLQARGEEVALVALLDAPEPQAPDIEGRITRQRLSRFSQLCSQATQMGGAGKWFYLAGAALQKIAKTLTYEIGKKISQLQNEVGVALYRQCLDRGLPTPGFLQNIPVRTIYEFAAREYTPAAYRGDVVLFRATETVIVGDASIDDTPYIEKKSDPLFGWGPRVKGEIEVCDVPGGHSSCLQEPYARVLATKIESYIETKQSRVLAVAPASARR